MENIKDKIIKDYSVNRMSIIKLTQKYAIPEYAIRELLYKRWKVTKAVSKPLPPAPDKQLLIDVYMKYKFLNRVGKAMGVSTYIVKRWMEAYKIPYKRGKFSIDEWEGYVTDNQIK